MGNIEDGKSSKSEKSSPPVTEQNGVHVYPDWAAMQAYYGPTVALRPYFNSAVAPGHPPPYLWGPPQPMMPPYGAPYGAIYAHGGVYARSAIPVGSPAPDQGGSSLVASTPLSIDTPAKSPGNTDKGSIKKLKGFDGLSMSIGNPYVEKADGAENSLSQSTTETEDSSDGSAGNKEEADQKERKRRRPVTPTTGEERTEIKASTHCAADKVLGVPVTVANGAGQTVGPVVATTLELNSPEVHVKGNCDLVPTIAVISPEAWIQNERELKQERRKQSNRESARRSRLRKQAEAEELARKVESLTSENVALKLELNKLVENSQKLRNENTTLMEKIKGLQGKREEENSMKKVEIKRDPTDSTENLLSRVDNSFSLRNEVQDTYEKKSSKSGSKLHQLLGTNPRVDAVAAG